MSLVTITEPSTTAVSLAEAKQQLVIDTADHDSYLKRLNKRAERMAEQFLGGYISTRTVELVLDGFPDSEELQIPTFPVQSITSMTYTDENGDSQTFTDFRSDLNGKVSKLIAIEAWPSTRERTPDAVKVRMVVGYSTVPEDIKHAILLKVAEMFERREESVIGASVTPSMNTFAMLLKSHRRYAL